MFRNLRLYRLHSPWPDTEESLSNQLGNAPFEPCAPYAERSMGFEPPVAQASSLARRIAGADLIRLRTQTRILPPAAVNEALDERLEAFRSRTQREPSAREKRDLKDEIHAELKPRALLKSIRTWGFYLRSEKLIGIDTTSEKDAERFLEQLRIAFGSLQVTPLEFADPLSKLLTRVFLGRGTPGFVSGRECRMVDPSTGTAVVNWLGIDLADPSIHKHVRDGLKIDRLGLEYDNVLSCVVGQDAVIRKLKFAGADVLEDEAVDDPLMNRDAEFALLTGTVKKLVGALKKQLGGYK
jgi:recombination associated protein RdgC